MKKLLLSISIICIIGLISGWFYVKLRSPLDKTSRALSTHSCYLLALEHSLAHIPCLRAEIEGIPFLAKLDTGYDGVLSLPPHLLNQLQSKKESGSVFFANIQGKKYKTRVYTIPQLNIEKLTLINFPAEESNFEFENDITLGQDEDLNPIDIIARIGWEAFKGTVLFIDLSKSVAICCDSMETLREKGYLLEAFASTDLLPGQEFLKFELNIGR